MGHKINHKMINEGGKIRKQNSATQTCFQFFLGGGGVGGVDHFLGLGLGFK